MMILGKPQWYVIFGTIILITSLLLRLFLELDAITKSTELSKKVVGFFDLKDVSTQDINYADGIIKKMMPLQILRMIYDKLIMIVIIVI